MNWVYINSMGSFTTHPIFTPCCVLKSMGLPHLVQQDIQFKIEMKSKTFVFRYKNIINTDYLTSVLSCIRGLEMWCGDCRSVSRRKRNSSTQIFPIISCVGGGCQHKSDHWITGRLCSQVQSKEAIWSFWDGCTSMPWHIRFEIVKQGTGMATGYFTQRKQCKENRILFNTST